MKPQPEAPCLLRRRQSHILGHPNRKQNKRIAKVSSVSVCAPHRRHRQRQRHGGRTPFSYVSFHQLQWRRPLRLLRLYSLTSTAVGRLYGCTPTDAPLLYSSCISSPHLDVRCTVLFVVSLTSLHRKPRRDSLQ